MEGQEQALWLNLHQMYLTKELKMNYQLRHRRCFGDSRSLEYCPRNIALSDMNFFNH